MKNAENLKHLFERFLEGNSSIEELNQLFDHFKTIDQSQLRELIRDELDREQNTDNGRDSDRKLKLQQLYQGISSRIDNSPKHGLIRVLRIAASVAAMLVLGYCLYLWSINRPVEIKTVYAAYGKRIEVHLPDSSKVWLNAGSTLQYPVTFKSDIRSVTLKEGEAFFEVIHNAHQPFIVHARSANVSVLGTSFEISAFEKEKETKIAVSTGKVGVQRFASNRNVTFLLPGDEAVINRTTNTIQKVQIDTADIGAWRNGRLIFEDQPIAEVMESLERKYNVHIEIQNAALLSKRVSMRLNNQPIANVLIALSFSKHFNYKIINEQLIIVK